jgi:NTE family protein
VLGGGGVIGTAWMAGLAAGLRRHGVDLGDADMIIGTSAGAIVGAMLATDRDLDQLAALPEELHDDSSQNAPDFRRLRKIRGVLGDSSLDDATARRNVAELVRDAPTSSEERQVKIMSTLIGSTAWPDRDLRIIASDAETGERIIWQQKDNVPLTAAVASSAAFPGLYPFITINGRQYMDGSLRGGIHIDLAEGAKTLVVFEPIPDPRRPAPSVSTAGPDRTIVIHPAPPVARLLRPSLFQRLFQPSLFTPQKAWPPAYMAGRRQADGVIERIRAVWQASA